MIAEIKIARYLANVTFSFASSRRTHHVPANTPQLPFDDTQSMNHPSRQRPRLVSLVVVVIARKFSRIVIDATTPRRLFIYFDVRKQRYFLSPSLFSFFPFLCVGVCISHMRACVRIFVCSVGQRNRNQLSVASRFVL